jgi:hypothetical protein
MSVFCLVHGHWHGAWCWQRLIGELESRGHRAVAMGLRARLTADQRAPGLPSPGVASRRYAPA